MKLLTLLAFSAVMQLCVCAETNMCRMKEPCSVTYKTIGCYRDDVKDRALPHYIYNERDSTISNYGNRNIEWYNWNNYVAEFSCRCAQKAKEQGYHFFGVQFYGECWAGKKEDNYARHHPSEKCVGDDYNDCHALTDRYCAGEQETNFVYEIVDTTCSLEFEEIGCYKDEHVSKARPLADYILTDRDSSVDVYSGQSIDWRNYDVYLPDFACRCAKKAKEHGATHFGLQFYGECWSHKDGANTFGIDGPGDNCIDGCYRECGGKKMCVGKHFRNYVYRIKSSGEQGCHLPIQSIGCFKEKPNSRALGHEMKNIFPGSDVFYGHRYTEGKWKDFFPDFLCRCAAAAKGSGYEYFGVSDFGDCYAGGSGYNKHGSSSACGEGPSVSGLACSSGSMLCSGRNKNAMYVYKVSSSSKKKSFDQNPPFPDNIERKRVDLNF